MGHQFQGTRMQNIAMHHSNTRKRFPTNSVACAALALLSTVALGAVPKAPAKICVDARCVTTTDSPSTGIKWHPGHYMMLRSRYRNPAAELPWIDAIGNESNIQGVLVIWLWSALETGKGQYDFSSIDQYLNRMKSLPQPKRLIIRIEERAFNTTTNTSTPSYLRTDPAYNGGEALMANGTIARTWEAPVMDRMIALYQALGKKYDADPYVEGISTEETAVGFSSAHPAPATFSNAALLTQFERLGGATRAAWPHSNVFMTTNYLGTDTQMEELIKYSVANRLAIGGPDTWGRSFVDTGTRTLQSDAIVKGIRGSATDYRGLAAIKAEVEDTEIGGYIGAFTPADLFDVAYNTLRANYMLWDRNNYAGGPAQKWDTGILPFIRSIGGKTVSDCPSSFGGACVTK
jgi:hypothetical protein